MKTQRLLVTLTAINFMLLVFLLAQMRPVEANTESSVLRGRGLEIVDDHGRVRASIKIYPASDGVQPDGTRGYPETVLLRLITTEGSPKVKISASEDGGGLSLGGESPPTYAALGARGGEPKLRLMNKDGKLHVITP